MFTALGFGLLINVVLPAMAIAGLTMVSAGIIGIANNI